MTLIESLIHYLSPSERNTFIQYLKKRNKRTDTKNVSLFEALIVGNEAIIKNKIGQNAYGVLKKRLTDRLIDFSAGIMVKNQIKPEIEMKKKLLIGQKLLIHSNYKEGFKILNKAKTEAYSTSDFQSLNAILQTLIHYSYHTLSSPPDILFKEYEVNKADILAKEKLNMVYAVIRKAFQEAEYNGTPVDLQDLIQISFKKYKINIDRDYNFQSLYQIAQIANLAGTYGKDYHSIDLFFVDAVGKMQGGTLDTEQYMIYHIDLLYLIANIYFRKKQFLISIDYLDKMYFQMQRYTDKYIDNKQISYSTLMALNLNFTGDFIKAKSLLIPIISKSIYSIDTSSNKLQAYLALVMIHFQQNELKLAHEKLSLLQRSDKWYEKKVGIEWLLNKKFIELLLHIELGNTDYADTIISNLLRSYSPVLSQSKFQALPFLKLIKRYYQNPSIANSSEFENLVKNTINWKPSEKEDLFLMSFYAWLKSKMIQKPLYAVTLELVELR